jgi:class 3 adenylate cyclase
MRSSWLLDERAWRDAFNEAVSDEGGIIDFLVPRIGLSESKNLFYVLRSKMGDLQRYTRLVANDDSVEGNWRDLRRAFADAGFKKIYDALREAGGDKTVSDSSEADSPDDNRSLRAWLGADRASVTVVATDIIGSTALNRKLGDSEDGKVRNLHFARVRAVLKEMGGLEASTAGDSFLVLFRAAGRALDFALAIQRNTGEERIGVKVGINGGEVSVNSENGLAQGVTLNYVTRVIQKSDGTTVVCSQRTRNDIDKAGEHRELKWREHVTNDMKGFEDTQRTLWSVNSRVD